MKIWKNNNTLNNSDSIEKIIDSFNLYEKYGCILNEKMLEGNMERIKQEMEKDPEFNKRLNSSLKDLSELYPQYRYSFDEEAWNEGIKRGLTFFEFLEYLHGAYRDLKFLLSEDKTSLIGWMVYQESQVSISDIKFGAFFPENHDKNYILLKDSLNELKKMMKENLTIVWRACKKNQKVINRYYKLIEKYDGMSFPDKDSSMVTFVITNPEIKEAVRNYFLNKNQP